MGLLEHIEAHTFALNGTNTNVTIADLSMELNLHLYEQHEHCTVYGDTTDSTQLALIKTCVKEIKEPLKVSLRTNSSLSKYTDAPWIY